MKVESIRSRGRAVFALAMAAVLAFSLSFSFQMAAPAYADSGSASMKTGQVATDSAKVTPSKKVSLNKSKLTLTMLKSYKLKLKNAKVKSWKSSNKNVARVNSKGQVVAYGTGKATITCTAKNGKKYKCAVTVKNPNIRCQLKKYAYRNGGYVQFFYVTNKCGKKLQFNLTPMWYYEKGLNSGHTNLTLYSKVNIANKKSGYVGGWNKIDVKLYKNVSEVLVPFKVGKTSYGALFTASSGKLIYWARL